MTTSFIKTSFIVLFIMSNLSFVYSQKKAIEYPFGLKKTDLRLDVSNKLKNLNIAIRQEKYSLSTLYSININGISFRDMNIHISEENGGVEGVSFSKPLAAKNELIVMIEKAYGRKLKQILDRNDGRDREYYILFDDKTEMFILLKFFKDISVNELCFYSYEPYLNLYGSFREQFKL